MCPGGTHVNIISMIKKVLFCFAIIVSAFVVSAGAQKLCKPDNVCRSPFPATSVININPTESWWGCTNFGVNADTRMYSRNNMWLNIIMDKETGGIVLSESIPLRMPTGVSVVKADDKKVREVARYTVDGRRISVPLKGVNLVKYSDGKIKKIIVK